MTEHRKLSIRGFKSYSSKEWTEILLDFDATVNYTSWFIDYIEILNEANDIKSLVEAEKVKPTIDKIFPFSETIDALVYQKSGRAKGKIVVKMK